MRETQITFEVFRLQPMPGHVFGVAVRAGRKGRQCHFQIGFCQAVLFAGGYAFFEQGFRREDDVAMSQSWAKPANLGLIPQNQISLELIPSTSWMAFLKS
jgi:hypothetical protein